MVGIGLGKTETQHEQGVAYLPRGVLWEVERVQSHNKILESCGI